MCPRFAAWLRKHDEVEMITRDRGGVYAGGANQGAPLAAQITDGYHLVSNLREVLERAVQKPPLEARARCVDAKGSAGEVEQPKTAL